MTNVALLLGDLAADFKDRNEHISCLCRCPLLILEDSGMERDMPMADRQRYDIRIACRLDCVTEIRIGNSILVASGCFKKDTTTAVDKMARVLEAEVAAIREPGYPA